MNVFRPGIRAGLLAIFSLAIVIAAVGVFSHRHKTYFVFFENANELQIGGGVTVSGVGIGRIVAITAPVPERERPAPQYEVRVEIQVARDVKFRNDSKVALTSYSLLGNSYIEFTGGHEANGFAAPGRSFIGNGPPKPPNFAEAVDAFFSATKEAAAKRNH